ncbi:putative tyrosine-protein phosphatase OCA1 [Rhodotorula diobovata]|uniref:Putative tyrosine-protein phosphatase OCA1 n=1 Tax=Rhodotorula diobovata TaxID=5288 RepID=A0A5C5G6Y3_9BASI|nr:putative tyrosine-protein phosphatase OCA1 [Rhodotorula diobovata]
MGVLDPQALAPSPSAPPDERTSHSTSSPLPPSPAVASQGGPQAIACLPATTASDGTRVAVCRVRPSKRVFIPPPQFGLVEEGLVRSGQPSELNFPFLDKLGLKTVVWLAPEDPNEPFQRFLQEHSVALHHLGADDYAATYDPLSEETVLQALGIILNPDNAPTLVCCNQGRHRTGTVCGVLRKLQKWNLVSILEEYRRYAGPKVRQHNEQFIELFDVQLCAVPPPAPEPTA